MTRIATTLVGLAVVVSSAASGATRFDFACDDVKALVRLMQYGPDEVIRRASADPVAYRDRSIRGWACLMTPLPPLKNGRVYLQSLDCYADNGDSNVTEQDLTASGALFQTNLASFNACFGSDLLSEAPISYTHNHRGEGIRAVLGDSYEGRHIIVQYGYLWDQVQTGRIVWQSIVGYSSSTGGSTPGNVEDEPQGEGDSRMCSRQCRRAENQCIDECGPGPDHFNNPNWLYCRRSCRSDASVCRDGCSDE